MGAEKLLGIDLNNLNTEKILQLPEAQEAGKERMKGTQDVFENFMGGKWGNMIDAAFAFGGDSMMKALGAEEVFGKDQDLNKVKDGLVQLLKTGEDFMKYKESGEGNWEAIKSAMSENHDSWDEYVRTASWVSLMIPEQYGGGLARKAMKYINYGVGAVKGGKGIWGTLFG